MRMPHAALLGLMIPALALAAPAAKDPAAKPAPTTQAPGTPPASPGAPGAQQQPGMPTPEQRAAAEKQILEEFKGKKNFELEGTAAMIDTKQGSIIVRRDDLPIAFLIVPQAVPVQLNGKKATLADLKEGDEIRATFNLAQQYPIALSIDAKKGTGAATKPGTPGTQPQGTQPQGTQPQGTQPAPAPVPVP